MYVSSSVDMCMCMCFSFPWLFLFCECLYVCVCFSCSFLPVILFPWIGKLLPAAWADVFWLYLQRACADLISAPLHINSRSWAQCIIPLTGPGREGGEPLQKKKKKIKEGDGSICNQEERGKNRVGGGERKRWLLQIQQGWGALHSWILHFLSKWWCGHLCSSLSSSGKMCFLILFVGEGGGGRAGGWRCCLQIHRAIVRMPEVWIAALHSSVS